MSLNLYALVALTALLGELALTAVAGLLNVRAISGAVPDEFRDVFDPDTYARSQAYTKTRTRLDLMQSATSLAVLLPFWFAGGFGWLDGLARSAELGSVATGLLWGCRFGSTERSSSKNDSDSTERPPAPS